MYIENFECLICGKNFDNSRKLSSHIRKEHGIEIKDYFDSYIEPFEHVCKYCGKPLIFKSFVVGYTNTCGAKECVRKRISDYNKTEEYKQKYESTMLKKYGTKYPAQNPEIHSKQINTNLARYGGKSPASSKNVVEKMKKTNIERIGVSFPGQSAECVEKMKETSIKRYGVENFSKTEEFKQGYSEAGKYRTKTKETNIKKYGFEHQMKNENIKTKVKKTCSERYGVENVIQYDKFKHKKNNTMLERYGYEYSAQSPEIASKMRKRIIFDGIAFDSNAEIEIYKFCKENKLTFTYQPKHIEYIDSKNRKHYYNPDFEIEGRLIEVKGDYLWKEGKLYFPYRNNLTEQELAEKDDIYLSKSNCMLENNVLLLLQSQIATGEYKKILNEELNLQLVL